MGPTTVVRERIPLMASRSHFALLATGVILPMFNNRSDCFASRCLPDLRGSQWYSTFFVKRLGDCCPLDGRKSDVLEASDCHDECCLLPAWLLQYVPQCPPYGYRCLEETSSDPTSIISRMATISEDHMEYASTFYAARPVLQVRDHQKFPRNHEHDPVQKQRM